MIRKTYPLRKWTTLDDLSSVVSKIEHQFPHMHCRFDIHLVVLEIICKRGTISDSEQITIHNLCRPIWDKKFKNLTS